MLQPVQLFKILSDETRLAIIQQLLNLSQKFRDIWPSYATPGWFSIAGKESGFITVYPLTCQPGRLRPSPPPGSDCERRCVDGWQNRLVSPADIKTYSYKHI